MASRNTSGFAGCAAYPSKNPPEIFQLEHLFRILITALVAGLLLFAGPIHAQDIDDVMEGLDQDFKFGGKEDIKQNNKTTTNEALREDTAISNSQPGQVDVLFFVHEYIMGANEISINVSGITPSFSFDEGSYQFNLGSFPANSTRSLKITCNNGPCEFYVFIFKGALFSPSQLEDTGPTPLILSDGQMTTLDFKVNKDNTGEIRPLPSLPLPTPS
ncbi:MAG: hypothetical protein G3M70_02930 [Candidatus Nitronauta litoralis]|uniref:Uncharacterized protein n=1 Tax=Candidatus Nitronauta litoralis TaxID=2705533 RepID=A0A7T0BTY1_9BACT|nr:MAG: hypothetical protein G3M70_02930 [Candidatus Nitronauta litoralis]